MITIPITFCMLIAKYLCLLKPFWLRKNNKTSVLLIIIILAMILGVVKIQVWLNDWNNDFFNALSQKETDKLWQLVLWFPALLGIFVLISVNKTWLIKLLTIRWREWLTDYYLNRWFADKNYYFTQIYGEHKNTDNPDQRIALARLILRRPKWIFLDETTSHLEEQEAIRLLRLVREKLPTSGVIMVTHQPGVWNLADDICDISTVL
ncbi:hypothetical protein NBY28_11910 [Escherichia coli]|nr:SbmA/BacA-like family transporter [Escherichia coli]URU52754.1 hypothetical protein NBY28_11910 [Escherichia coli]